MSFYATTCIGTDNKNQQQKKQTNSHEKPKHCDINTKLYRVAVMVCGRHGRFPLQMLQHNINKHSHTH